MKIRSTDENAFTIFDSGVPTPIRVTLIDDTGFAFGVATMISRTSFQILLRFFEGNAGKDPSFPTNHALIGEEDGQVVGRVDLDENDLVQVIGFIFYNQGLVALNPTI